MVTLLEILRIYAHSFVEIAFHLDVAMETMDTIWKDEMQRWALVEELEELRNVCDTSDLPVTRILVDSILTGFNLADKSENPQLIKDLAVRFQEPDTLRHKLFTLRERFVDELSTKLFLQIPHSRKALLDTPLAGWDSIMKRFPECIRDIEEMNKCFALSRYTASMFHALHIAEWGAIALGDRIGVTNPRKGWGPTSAKLSELVKEGHKNFPPMLAVGFEFIEQMNREVETMMLAWRHKVDHAANALAIVPNAEFTPDIAEHVGKSVKVFMTRLLEGGI
jgi:hypothetical protein